MGLAGPLAEHYKETETHERLVRERLESSRGVALAIEGRDHGGGRGRIRPLQTQVPIAVLPRMVPSALVYVASPGADRPRSTRWSGPM